MKDPAPPSTLPDGAERAIFGPALDWWGAVVKQTQRLPTRRDLLPERLGARTLPFVLLVDVGDGGAQLRFRLMGSAHVAFNQADFSGRDFDGVYSEGPALAYVRGLYKDMCKVRRPLWSVNEVRHFRTGLPIVIRRLMLPMSVSGRDVDLSLGVQTIHQQPGRGIDMVNPWHVARAIEEHERRFL
jgi:hypothetical protein